MLTRSDRSLATSQRPARPVPRCRQTRTTGDDGQMDGAQTDAMSAPLPHRSWPWV